MGMLRRVGIVQSPLELTRTAVQLSNSVGTLYQYKAVAASWDGRISLNNIHLLLSEPISLALP